MEGQQQHRTIRDVAKELNMSYSKARDLIKNEPGVLVFSNGKRKMRRVPPEVFGRIVRRSMNPTVPRV